MQKNAINLIFGLKVRLLRQQQGLTYQQLSDKTGMAVSFIHDIEKGKKYPGGDKILALARALGVNYDMLVRLHGDTDIKPIVDLLESDFFQHYPLELFGLDTQTIVELLASNPLKTNYLISAVRTLGAQGRISKESIFSMAMEAYRKNALNYFPELEASARQFRKEQELDHTGSASIPSHILERLLTKLYGISIDREKLPTKFVLRDVLSCYSPAKKVLYFNKDLTTAQESYFISRELGYQYLGIEKRSLVESDTYDINSWEQFRNDFHASYFAKALLIEEHSLLEDFRQAAGNVQWVTAEWLALLTKYRATPDILLSRLANLLPKHFQLRNLFMVRITGNEALNQFKKTREFNISELQTPFSIATREHFCRRWPAVEALRALKASNAVNLTHTVASAQINRSLIDNNDYFCISMAQPQRSNINAGACTTLGFLLDDTTQRLFRFTDSPKLHAKPVHSHCETCMLTDCNERAAAADADHDAERQNRMTSALSELDIF